LTGFSVGLFERRSLPRSDYVVSAFGFTQAYGSAVNRFRGRLEVKSEEGGSDDVSPTTGVPQRLKPRPWQDTYGTAEAVPLSETEFFRVL